MMDDVKKMVKEIFPDYRGRKINVKVTDSVTFYNTIWDGGSRNYYVALRLDSGRYESLPDFLPWSNPVEGAAVPLKPGIIVLCRTIFCGRDCGVTVYIPSVPPAGITGNERGG